MWWKKNYNNILSHISTEYRNATDEQTDRQTDGGTDKIAIHVSISRVSVLTRDNNSKMIKMIQSYTYNGQPIESHTWSIERRHFQLPWTTANLVVKVTLFFDAEYLRNGMRYRHSCNDILIGTYEFLKNVISDDLEWPWMTWRNIQWHKAWHDLSATAELHVLVYTTPDYGITYTSLMSSSSEASSLSVTSNRRQVGANCCNSKFSGGEFSTVAET